MTVRDLKVENARLAVTWRGPGGMREQFGGFRDEVVALRDALDAAEKKTARMQAVLVELQAECDRKEDPWTYDLIGTVADIWGQT